MTPPLSRPPAGVPAPGGNAKYAIVVLSLLGGIAALFTWRSCSSKPEASVALPPAPATSQPAAPPDNPKIDDIPPPPPTVAEEKGANASGPRIAYVPGAGCEGKCVGTAPPELEQALQARAQTARRCYNQALARDSSLKGHVTVSVRIGPSGNVCSAAVVANDMGSVNVANCVANNFRASGAFPSPRGGCKDATVPFSFVPMGQ